MRIGRLLMLSIAVGAAVALVSMLSVDFLFRWSAALDVPNLPLDKWQAMSEAEHLEFLQSGPTAIRTITGAEKAMYLLRASPVQFVWDWLWYFVPSAISAFLCAWLAGARRAP
jgi:hypothetical protein